MALSAAFAVLAGTGTAHANHDLIVAHQPPPAAVQGHDLALEVAAASSCAPFCSSMTFEAHYVDASGEESSVAINTPDFTPAAGGTITIPSDALVGSSFEYWIEVRQMRCVFAYDCHQITTTAPETGMYSVPVTANGIVA